LELDACGYDLSSELAASWPTVLEALLEAWGLSWQRLLLDATVPLGACCSSPEAWRSSACCFTLAARSLRSSL
jgi:hypothetical protein